MEIVGLLAIVLIAYWVFKWKSSKSDTANDAGSRPVVPQTTAASVAVQKQRAAAAATTKETAAVGESIKTVQAADAQKPAPATVKSVAAVKPQVEPEDSVLKRHYLSQQQAEKEASSNPYPTDSILRRHYESINAAALAVPSPSANAEPAAAASTESVTQEKAPQKTRVPEDSTLRRHFLAQVRAEVESGLSPRPTDSALIRHYDSLVSAKVDEYLA